LLEKNGFKKVHEFVNARTQNKVFLWVRDLTAKDATLEGAEPKKEEINAKPEPELPTLPTNQGDYIRFQAPAQYISLQDTTTATAERDDVTGGRRPEGLPDAAPRARGRYYSGAANVTGMLRNRRNLQRYFVGHTRQG